MDELPIRLDDDLTTSERLGVLLKAFRSGFVPTDEQFRSRTDLEYFVLLLTRSEAAGSLGIQFQADQCAWFAARGYDLAYERACAKRVCIDRQEDWDSDYEKRRPRHPDMRFELEELRARRKEVRPPPCPPIPHARPPQSRLDFLIERIRERRKPRQDAPRTPTSQSNAQAA
jgi:hypothetical protein